MQATAGTSIVHDSVSTTFVVAEGGAKIMISKATYMAIAIAVTHKVQHNS